MSVTVIFFPSNTHLEVQSHGVPFSISWGVSTLFPIVDVGVYITNKSAQGSLFWTTLSTLTSCLFDNSYSNRYDVHEPGLALYTYICKPSNNLVIIVHFYFFLCSSLLPYLFSIHYLGTCSFASCRHDTPVAAVNYPIPSPWIYMQIIGIGQFNWSSSVGCSLLDPRDTGLCF